MFNPLKFGLITVHPSHTAIAIFSELGRSRLRNLARMTLVHDLSRETTVEESKDVVESDTRKKNPTPAETPVFGFLFFGFVGLLCFNSLIQSMQYLNKVFSSDFSTYASLCYGFANNCGQLLIIFFGPRFPFSSRIYYSAIALSIILIAYPVVAILVTDQVVGIGLGLFLTFGLGFFNAIIQSAGFGLAGICSAKSMEFFSVGQALSGLLPGPLYMLVQVIFNAFSLSDEGVPDNEWTPLVVACNMTTLAIASLVTFLFVPYYGFFLSKAPMVKLALSNLDDLKNSELVQHRSKLSIIKDALPLAMSVWFILYVTFVVFPSHVLVWKSSYGINASLNVILTIYCFQCLDVVGRYMVSFWKLSPRQTKIGSAARALFIPLFFLCTFQVSFFANDITKMVLMALFAATNGFILTWGMIHGPGQVHKDEADVASYTMSFFLVNGIFFGSLTDLGVGKAIRGSIPQ
jgi:hypothetical protein